MHPEDIPYLIRSPRYKRKYEELEARFEDPKEFLFSDESKTLAREFGLNLLIPLTADQEADDIFIKGAFSETVRLIAPPGRDPLMCALEPTLWLIQGRFLMVALDLEATDAAIINELKRRMKELRKWGAVEQRTKRNQHEINPLWVWDEVQVRLNKSEWSDDEAKQVLWTIARQFSNDDFQQDLDKPKEANEWYQQLKGAYDKAHDKIMRL